MAMIEIHALPLTERLNWPVEKFLYLFSPKRQEAILRYRFPADRNRTLWTELLARSVIAQKASCPATEIVIRRDKRGKPHVVGSPLHISLSHSKNWAVCSVGKVPNGVDVEEETTGALAVAKNFFTAQEYQTLLSLDASACAETFLRMWTIKESYVKFTGQGISDHFGAIESNALLEGNAPVAGKNYFVHSGVIGICAPPGTLPQSIVVADRDFGRQLEK